MLLALLTSRLTIHTGAGIGANLLSAARSYAASRDILELQWQTLE